MATQTKVTTRKQNPPSGSLVIDEGQCIHCLGSHDGKGDLEMLLCDGKDFLRLTSDRDTFVHYRDGVVYIPRGRAMYVKREEPDNTRARA